VTDNGVMPAERTHAEPAYAGPVYTGRTYAEWPARRAPRESVACVWAARPTAGSPGLVLPDACIDVIWDGTALFVAGPDTGPVPLRYQAGLVYAGVRFRPGRAPGFLGSPASDMLDCRVPLADLWGAAEAARLADVLASAPGPRAAALLLEDAIAARARDAWSPDPVVDGLVALLRAEPDARGAVRTASTMLSVGERRLLRRCRAAVGYGPKTLDRVLRFQRAIRLATRSDSPGLLAVEAGYADQAHLTRECRRLAGITPSDLFKTAHRTAA
jgi:AraC-like DNA-binding protein